jgi:HAUS augmin-like complex subunit 1
MDSAPDLLPSAFFSPSKAKQQRAQAQDWQHVDTWLASKFQGRSIPQFERNEDTLKALLSLVAANEKADEERDLLWNVQKEALSELHTRKVMHFAKRSSSRLTLKQSRQKSPMCP